MTDIAKTPEEIDHWYKKTLEGLASCNHAEFDESKVEQVVAAGGHEGDYAESDSFFLAKLKDGSYAVGAQSEDTTGHGCQCSGNVNYFKDIYSAVALGLDQWTRDQLGIRIS